MFPNGIDPATIVYKEFPNRFAQRLGYQDRPIIFAVDAKNRVIPLTCRWNPQTKDWIWQRTGIAALGEALGVGIGLQVGNQDEFQTKIYQDTILKDASIIGVVGSYSDKSFPQGWGAQWGRTWRKYADDMNVMLDMLRGSVWPQDAVLDPALKTDSPDSVRAWIRLHFQRVLPFVHKISDGYKPTMVHYFTEPLSYDLPIRWQPDSPFTKAFGADVLIETYRIFFSVCQDLGLRVGKDIIPILNEARIIYNNSKRAFALEQWARTKDVLSRELGISTPFHVGMQVRLDAKNPSADSGTNAGRSRVPTPDELAETIQLFAGRVGPVQLSEIHVLNTDEAQRMAIVGMIADVAIQSGQVHSLVYEQPFQFDREPIANTDAAYIHFYNRDYTMTENYADLLKRLSSRLLTR